MKKQKIQFIVIIVLLVAVLGGYYYVTHNDLEQEEEEVNLSTVYLTNAEPDAIVKLNYFVDGSEICFIKEAGTWYYSEDKDFAISQSDLNNMANYVARISPSLIIEEPSELSEYGLDKPLNTITFTTDSGDVQTLYIGEYFDMDGTTFAMVDDDEKVYTVASYYATVFQKGLAELCDASEMLGDDEMTDTDAAGTDEETDTDAAGTDEETDTDVADTDEETDGESE